MAPPLEIDQLALDPLLGKRLGKYQVHKRLGQGGMGVVYEAEDTNLLRRVALKVLASSIVQDPAAHERFLREARAAASLTSPFIISIFEVDQQEGQVFLAMELFPGTSAQEHLLAQGPFPWRAATLIAAAACRGLAAVHERGIVHRDMKPANVMLSAKGLAELTVPGAHAHTAVESVKLADFGIAKCQSSEELSLTSAHTVLGTPVYMSPEQCRSEPLDARSDIYALGATYFALLTGRPPFSAEQPIQIMFAHCSSRVPNLQALAPQAPAGCQRIIERAMAKEPAERYQTVGEFSEALLALATEAPDEVARADVPAVPSERIDRPTVKSWPAQDTQRTQRPGQATRSFPRRWAGTMGMVALLVMLTGTLTYYVTRYVYRDPKSRRPTGANLVQERQYTAERQIQSLALSDDDDLLAYGLFGKPGVVRVRDLRTGLEFDDGLSGMNENSIPRSLTFVPGTELVAAALDNKIWVFRPRTGEMWPVVTLDKGIVLHFAVSPNSELWVFSEDQAPNGLSHLYRYALRQGPQHLEAVSPQDIVSIGPRIKALAMSRDGTQVAFIDADNVLRVSTGVIGKFEVRNLPPTKKPPDECSHALAFSADGRRLAAAADMRVESWMLPELVETRQFEVESESTNLLLAFVPGSHRLASASVSGVKFWNIETGRQIGQTYTDHLGERITSLVFIPQSDMLISGGLDRRISIRNWKQAAKINDE